MNVSLVISDFGNIITKNKLPFADCERRTCNFLLLRELGFVRNVQWKTGKGSDNVGGHRGLFLLQSKMLKSSILQVRKKSQYHHSRHFHLVTTLRRGEGVEMSKLDIENSLVERNGSFSESVSTTFVYEW